jgi:hypothetical protein
MYGRDAALRVQERVAAMAGFPDFSTDQVRNVGQRYGADVVVVERPRMLDLPRLYENGRFRVYDLRR